MNDMAPALLEQIQNDLERQIKGNKKLMILQELLENGKATYEEAFEYATETGELLSNTFRNNLSSDILPDGKLYYNIASRIIPSPIHRAFDEIIRYSGDVQKKLNESAGLGIRTIEPTLNEDRVYRIIDIVSGKDHYDDIAYMLGDKVVNLCQNAVDEMVKANAEFQYKAGLSPTITRALRGNGCDWCRNIAGVYSFEDAPKDIYRRHDYCKCLVTYTPHKGKAKIIHSGNEGKRTYTKDKYGGYELTKEARIERAKRMAATENERKERARQKRIATWEKKKSLGIATKKNSKGLSVKGDNGIIPNHEKAKLIGTVDFQNRLAVEKILDDFEKNAVDFKIETACVITRRGEIYKCFGTAAGVYPDYDLGEKIVGGVISHNHPLAETEFSFSKQDISLFQEYDLTELRGCDKKYLYTLTQNPDEIDEYPALKDQLSFENVRHIRTIKDAMENGFGYRRTKNER